MAEEEGTFVGGGRLRVDRKAALAKLAAFQLGERDLFVPWVRCAELSGAKRLDVSVTGRSLRVEFDGAGFTADELADPFQALFDDSDAPRRLGQLAAALLGVSRLPVKTLRLCSGDGKRGAVFAGKDLEALTPLPELWTPAATALSVELKAGAVVDVERAALALEGRLVLGKTAVSVNGKVLEAERVRGGLYELGGLRALLLAAEDPFREMSRLRLVVDGVAAQTIELATPWGPVDAVLTGPDLPLDASLSRVVEGKALAPALEALHAKMRDFAGSMAKVQAREATQTRRLLLDSSLRGVWGGEARPASRKGPLEAFLDRLGLGRGVGLARDESILEEAVLRTRWLRAACKGRLVDYEKEDDDPVRKALWNVPLFLTAAGGWFSRRGLKECISQCGTVYLSKNQGGVFTAYLHQTAAGRKSAMLRGDQVVWAPAPRDLDDLVALMGEPYVTPLD
ncbi:MAG: hypothetical protein HYZ75_08920 [Elusimicrobia bacterium]|nr:hypothetical protein [Elusimicrobiota bacterium]